MENEFAFRTSLLPHFHNGFSFENSILSVGKSRQINLHPFHNTSVVLLTGLERNRHDKKNLTCYVCCMRYTRHKKICAFLLPESNPQELSRMAVGLNFQQQKSSQTYLGLGWCCVKSKVNDSHSLANKGKEVKSNHVLQLWSLKLQAEAMHHFLRQTLKMSRPKLILCKTS